MVYSVRQRFSRVLLPGKEKYFQFVMEMDGV